MNEDEGKVVMDFSWEDEDPIDKHIELLKAKAEWQDKRNLEQGHAISTRETSPKQEINVMLGRPGLGD